MITLAAVGIGLFGAIPILLSNRKKENIFETQLVETKEESIFKLKLINHLP